MKFDIGQIKKLLSPHAYKDMDSFVREMPMRAGQTILIAGGVVWMIAAAGFVFTTVESEKIAKLRADVFKAEALKPVVPTIVNRPVDAEALKEFALVANQQYPNVEISTSAEKITLKATDLQSYWSWREAVGHVFNGGAGWRLSIDSLCAGRECKDGALNATFSVNTLEVQQPAPVAEGAPAATAAP